MTSPQLVDDRTLTTSGTDLDAAALGRWRRRLADRLVVERDLPWRETRDPWAILVAEAMLQQTQVSRVLPAWCAFLDEMPTPSACADAGRAAVIRRWEGLGYHRRAVALHSCAVTIGEQHDGKVPDELDSLCALPGVGPYTARAVLAFAFERDVAVVDTNVARILSRAVAGAPLTARRSQEVADALVAKGNGWRHNQALLDLGALHCRPTPKCDGCVLLRSCVWARAGRPEPDPARTTAGTSRPQPKFEGSDRQLRGQLLAAARNGLRAASTKRELSLRFDSKRVELALRGLQEDGLVRVVNGQLSLA